VSPRSPALPAMKAGVLIVSHEAPGTAMSGPAIRCWQLAQALSAHLPVTLAVPAPVDLPPGRVRIVVFERDTGQALRACADSAAVVLVAGFVLRHYPFLSQWRQPMIVDLYDPFTLENLAIHSTRPLTEQTAIHRVDQSVLLDQLGRGDFFLCASEQQRDYWLGMLAGAGRINPHTYAADPTLRRLIAVVPFGVPDEPAQRGKGGLRGVAPGISAGDQIVYWGGGLWDWFDPVTAIKAVELLARRLPNIRLFFAGVAHPNPAVPPMRQAAAAQQLSHELGLTNRHVFFNQWVPYGERVDYLLDADVGLSLHFDQIETRFSFRTRLLDYIWTGLPMVLTGGDTLSGQAAERGLARLVPAGDAAGVAEAVAGWLDEAAEARAAREARAKQWAGDLRWSHIVGPLLAFCRQPRLADDHQGAPARPAWQAGLPAKAWQSLRRGGLAGLLRDIRIYWNI
jgi:glycosyltransferase involved in cell wall biosynthesis